jgi:hypothetical protein
MFEDGFLTLYEDDDLRIQEMAYPPKYRQWRLAYEEDGINWFHSGVSNIVLAAWARYPAILQASHESRSQRHEWPNRSTLHSRSSKAANGCM